MMHEYGILQAFSYGMRAVPQGRSGGGRGQLHILGFLLVPEGRAPFKSSGSLKDIHYSNRTITDDPRFKQPQGASLWL